jgi:glycosyltransferase involved in cell wall biosynthesis
MENIGSMKEVTVMYHVLQVLRPMEGGMRRHVLDLIEGLQAAGHQVTVACPSDSPLRRDLYPWVPVETLELVDDVSPVADLRAALQLRQILRRASYDLVHLHGAKAGIVGRLAARMTERRPAVVYTVHNQVAPRSALQRRVLHALERRLAPDTDRLITVSHFLQEDLVTRHRCIADRVVTIHNGVDPLPPLDREHARAVLGCSRRTVIGAIGRMVPEKGFSTLLAAFQIVLARGYDAELVLIGDGPQHSVYQKMAGKNARFLGTVPKAARLMLGFDIIVQPSHAEGLGLVPIEAMLQGRPVIASEVGGLPEVVEHGKTGLLVPPRDEISLADAIQLLLVRPDLREALGKNGKKKAEELFTRRAMLEATLRQYEAAMAFV